MGLGTEFTYWVVTIVNIVEEVVINEAKCFCNVSQKRNIYQWGLQTVRSRLMEISNTVRCDGANSKTDVEAGFIEQAERGGGR